MADTSIYAMTTILGGERVFPKADFEPSIHVQGITEEVSPGETRKGVGTQKGEEVSKGTILGKVPDPA